MAITKQQREKADRIIDWFKALKTRKKTTGRLGRKDQTTGEWRYCCLGVACRINKLDTDYCCGTDARLIDLLGLTDESGNFEVDRGDYTIKFVDNDEVEWDLSGEALTSTNDELFYKDTTFLRQRRLMLLTLDHWIKDPTVARSVKARMRDEIKRIQKMSDRQRGFRLEKA